jgi:hypothetical protein
VLSGNTPEVERIRHEVLSIREGISSRGPQTVERKRRLAEAIVKVGDLLPFDESSLDEKMDLYDRAKAIHVELNRDFPTHVGVMDDLCWSYARLSHCHDTKGESAKARLLRQARLRLSMRLLSSSHDRALSHHNAAWAHTDIGRHSNDEDTILSQTYLALLHAREAVAREPDRIAFRETLLTALVERANAICQFNGVEDARPMIVEAVNETDRMAALNPDHPLVGHSPASRRIWGAQLLAAGMYYGDSGRLAAQGLRMLNMDMKASTRPAEAPGALGCVAVKLIEEAAERGGISPSLRREIGPSTVPAPPFWPEPSEEEFWPSEENARPSDSRPFASR